MWEEPDKSGRRFPNRVIIDSSGHSVLMGKKKLAGRRLCFYGTKKTAARKEYREYVEKGVSEPGGGLKCRWLGVPSRMRRNGY